MLKYTLVSLAVLVVASPALAQQAVYTVPVPSSSLNGDASGTIAVTNTFQKVFGATQGNSAGAPGTASTRKGCTVQNNGTHNMYVNEGTPIGGATTSNTVLLPAGSALSCAGGGTVLTGEIDITGTAGDSFVAKQF